MIPPTWMTDHFDIYLTWDQLSLIIAILAALLLPVLSGAKLRAQQIKSLSNVKQLTLAGFIYSNDNAKNPAYRDPNYLGGGAWMGTLALSFRSLKESASCQWQRARLRGPGLGPVDVRSENDALWQLRL